MSRMQADDQHDGGDADDPLGVVEGVLVVDEQGDVAGEADPQAAALQRPGGALADLARASSTAWSWGVPWRATLTSWTLRFGETACGAV